MHLSYVMIIITLFSTMIPAFGQITHDDCEHLSNVLDESFLKWCLDFFEYKWNSGEQFARLR